MVELTYMHYIYLAVIVVVIALMILKHDVVVPCIVGLFVLGFCYSGFSVIGGAQAVFNGMMVAGADLFDIMLIIALMVAMLKAMEAIGADKMMIAPAARVIKSPTVAFVVIAVVMYICASFFWPTPATALVGTILIPIAMKAGLKPMMACMAMNLAGHGLALSGDLVLQGAPALSAGASNADLPSIVANGGILATLTGVVAFAVAAVIYRKEITARYIPDGTDNVQQAVEVANPPKCAKVFAVIVPVVFFVIVLRIIAGAAIPTMSKIFGGDATALLGGAASILLILICLVTDSKTFLEKIGEYLRTGMLFSIKIFAVVIPIAAFFYLGNPESCPSILGEGAPGIYLPKFSTEGITDAEIEFSSYHHPLACELTLMAACHGMDEYVILGKVTAPQTTDGWKKFSYTLPESLQGQKWVDARLHVNFIGGSSSIPLIDSYSIRSGSQSGLEETTAEAAYSVTGQTGAILFTGFQGETARVFLPAGIQVAATQLTGESMSLPVAPGIYVVTVGEKTFKVAVD